MMNPYNRRAHNPKGKIMKQVSKPHIIVEGTVQYSLAQTLIGFIMRPGQYLIKD